MFARDFVIPLVVLLVTADPQQSEPTLVELARLHGGINMQSLACGPSTPLEDIVSRATVIVYGTVMNLESRLSGDERHVLTDYRVQPFVRLYDGSTPAGRLTEPLLFTVVGGTVFIEGYEVSETHKHNGRSVKLNAGDEVILMGSVEKEMLTLHPTSVFKIIDGAVRANGDVVGFRRDDPEVPLDQFLTRVSDLLARPSNR